jgi:hypothetical protein
MARSGVIVIRNKDQHLPEKLKENLLATCRAVGCVFVDSGKIESYSGNERASSISIKQSEDAFNFRQIYWFGCSEADFLEDDLQPFVIVQDAAGNAQIVAMLEGMFTPYDHPEDNHSTSYFVVNETLADKVNKVFEDCDEDLTKTMSILQSDDFKNDLKSVLHPDGVITLLCINGDLVTYHPKDYSAYVTGPWGWSSKAMGYTEPKPAIIDTTGGSTMTAAERLAAKRAAAKSGAPGTGAQPSVPAVAQKTDTRIPESAIDPIQLPPPEYLTHRNSHKLINKWWNRNFEFGADKNKRPSGWESGKIGFPYSKLKVNSSLRARRPGEQIIGEPGGVSIPPIISAKHIEIMNSEKGFLKDVNEDSPNLLDLKSINEIEENYSSFFDQCDYPLHLFLRWSLKKKRDFVKEYPQAAYTALVDLCTMLVKQNPKLLETPPKKEEEKREVEQPVQPTAPPVDQPPQTAAERLAAKRAANKAAAAA